MPCWRLVKLRRRCARRAATLAAAASTGVRVTSLGSLRATSASHIQVQDVAATGSGVPTGTDTSSPAAPGPSRCPVTTVLLGTARVFKTESDRATYRAGPGVTLAVTFDSDHRDISESPRAREPQAEGTVAAAVPGFTDATNCHYKLPLARRRKKINIFCSFSSSHWCHESGPGR